MRVAGPLPTLQAINPTPGSTQRTLLPGQVLHAVVVSPATAGTALLRVGELELTARTELALTKDQALLLEVVKGGDTPELRVLRTGGEEGLIARALRTSLPRRAAVADQLGRIGDAWRRMATDKTVASGLAREVGALLNRPLATGTDPASLRQALAHSGLFFEGQLAQGRFDAADLKGVLLRLLARLPGQAGRSTDMRGAPPAGSDGPLGAAADPDGAHLETLRHLAENALAGIRWQQISSLPDDAGRGALWHVELPLRTPDDAATSLWLRTERDPDGRQAGGRHWTVDLSLAVPPLGTLHAHLSLLGDQLSATLWAECEDAARLFGDQLGLLGAGLERAGIRVAHLAARAGRPPVSADQPAPPLQGLLDERA